MTYKEFKQVVYRRLIPFIRVWNYVSFRIYLFTHERINLVVGAGGTYYKNWFSTDISVLNVTKTSDFDKYFSKKKISKILAEHVLEHLKDDDLHKMLNNFSRYTSPDINIRIAVPDGYHTDKNYIDMVKPGGIGSDEHQHEHLFTYKSLSAYFEKYSFKPVLIEYWDETGEFYTTYKNDENGFISRCLINDERNINGKPVYTSLIIDFKK